MSAVMKTVIDGFAQLDEGAAVFAASFAGGLRVPVPVPIDEWADEHRFLPREASSEPGKFRTVRTPYLREPMQVMSDGHPSKMVVMVFGTQLGKTETGNNFVGSVIHQTPGPMMIVQPTVDMGKRWTRQRLDPMIAHTPVLSDRIKPARSRDSGNTANMKEYPGGVVIITGANSAAGLRSMPVRFLFMDEIDAYPYDVDGEGNPIDLAERRTATFPRRKILLTSTPTVKDESAIWGEFEKSDQRYYFVACPHCGHEQVLRDENLTNDGTMLCGAGGHFIDEHYKTDMLANGKWVAQKPESDTPGFHLASYYSPIGLGYSWLELAAERAETKEKPEKKKTYTNTIMAECYEDESGKLDWKEISERAGGYSSREIPDGCLMLTAGVDTQDDRWEVHIMGWGRKRWWTIDYIVVPGRPGVPEEWKKLDAILDMRFRNRYGVDLRALAMAVDTGGHHTHTAYQYCRIRKHRRVLAIKGSKFTGKPIIPSRPSPVDVNVRGQVIRAGVDLWHIGVDTARGAIFARLQADSGKEPEDCRFRFPGDLPDDFFQQLTAARFDSTKQRWIKPRHKRHEVGDTTNYALAAACHPAIRIDKLRDRDWEKIEAKVQPMVQDMFGDEQGAPAPKNEPAPAPEKHHAADEKDFAEKSSAEPQNTQPEPTKPKPTKPRRKPKRRGRLKGGFA